MSDENPPSASLPGQPERRRPAPTIDLKATEVAAGAPAGAAPEQTADLPSTEAPRPESAAAESPSRPPEEPGAPRSYAWWPIGIAIGGVALALVIVLLVALAPWAGDDSAALQSRIGRLEQKLAELAARPSPGAADRQSNADPSGRIAELEARLAALNDMIGALTGRSEDAAAVAADARRRADADAAALAELSRSFAQTGLRDSKEVDQIAAQSSALDGRISTVETGVKAVEAELVRRASEGADDRVARTAVVAATLALAVERGDGFERELAAARAQAKDPKLLAPLDPFAASGVPGVSALARELSALEPVLVQAAGGAPPDGSLFEKLEAHAEKLVRIRPSERVQGDQATAIIARVEARAAREDLSGVLAELGKLPAEARVPAQAWIAKVEAREAAVEASRRFAADALAGLGKPSP
jgi:hypothetical protein